MHRLAATAAAASGDSSSGGSAGVDASGFPPAEEWQRPRPKEYALSDASGGEEGGGGGAPAASEARGRGWAAEQAVVRAAAVHRLLPLRRSQMEKLAARSAAVQER